MLWAADGDVGTGLVTDYDHGRTSAITPYGEQLPYLREVVEKNFDLGSLNFARLAVIAGSVTIPHRDLLELAEIPEGERNAHRVHVPLVTNDSCYFTEGNVVYQMRVGDVWFLDASREHGAAVLSPEPRTHLILDFADRGSDGELFRFDAESSGSVPTSRIRERPPLTDAERKDLLGLAGVIDLDNYRDVFSIVIKKHYRADGGDNFVWETLDEIARLSEDEKVRSKVRELHRFFLLERSA